MKEFYGHTKFRPHQWKIINTILDGKDQLAILTTGYGKSLCYQFPSIYKKGITIVISPLISLMNDQVWELQSQGISANQMGCNQPDTQKIKQDSLNGDIKILYITPEWAIYNIDHLAKIHRDCPGGILCFAVDEAHC